MLSKRTVTTRETFHYDGTVKEVTRTHIATGAHGYEALCVSGSSVGRDKSCVITNEIQLPVTCHVCLAVWKDVQDFEAEDFDPGLL